MMLILVRTGNVWKEKCPLCRIWVDVLKPRLELVTYATEYKNCTANIYPSTVVIVLIYISNIELCLGGKIEYLHRAW